MLAAVFSVLFECWWVFLFALFNKLIISKRTFIIFFADMHFTSQTSCKRTPSGPRIGVRLQEVERPHKAGCASTVFYYNSFHEQEHNRYFSNWTQKIIDLRNCMLSLTKKDTDRRLLQMKWNCCLSRTFKQSAHGASRNCPLPLTRIVRSQFGVGLWN